MVLDPRTGQKEKPKPTFPFKPFLLFLLILASIPFIEFDENLKPKLADWREKKLLKELDDMDRAEQYVLTAKASGQYPCYSCLPSGVDSLMIFLQAGEVWKYGITTKGKKGRYGNSLEAMNLKYQVQFVGSLKNCLQQEKIKIYHYPLLPECLKRDFLLIRPPGNKQDN